MILVLDYDDYLMRLHPVSLDDSQRRAAAAIGGELTPRIGEVFEWWDEN